jgi:hypothetical protein
MSRDARRRAGIRELATAQDRVKSLFLFTARRGIGSLRIPLGSLDIFDGEEVGGVRELVSLPTLPKRGSDRVAHLLSREVRIVV